MAGLKHSSPPARNWIVYAKKPFDTTQLLQALAIRNGDSVFDSSAMTTEEELLYLCSSLVRRNQSSETLELAHFTLKEFLITLAGNDNPDFAQPIKSPTVTPYWQKRVSVS